MVVGEHGTCEVLLWSSASVGIPILELLCRDDQPVEQLRQEIENDIRYASITILKGPGRANS